MDNLDYSELLLTCTDYPEIFNKLYRFNPCNEAEIAKLFEDIKNKIIETKVYSPSQILTIIMDASLYNSSYLLSYWTLFKKLVDEYQPNQIKFTSDVFYYIYYKEYGVILDESKQKHFPIYERLKVSLNFHQENPIYRAIVNDDKELFVSLAEIPGFNHNKRLKSDFYFYNCKRGLSLLELCCYHGSVKCFKFLKEEHDCTITPECPQLSFLGGNPDIMSQCLKYQKPNKECMKFAIISHSIDFVTFLMNEYKIAIDVKQCSEFNNIEASLVYLHQTKNVFEWLHYSTYYKIPSLWEYLFAHGLDINIQNGQKDTALTMAVEQNKMDAVEALIMHGANVDAVNNCGRTALILAVQNKRLDIAEFLFQHGANINATDKKGVSAIHLAIKNNFIDIIKLFISNGEDINASALNNAVMFNSKEIVDILILHGANINAKGKNGKTAIHIAAIYGRKELAELLLSIGADINAKDKKGRNALHHAIGQNDLESLEKDLESEKIDIHSKDINYDTYVGWSTNLTDNMDIVELLISHGIDINSRDNDGDTALHLAAFLNVKDVVEFLIPKCADINAKDNYGKTALHWAAFNNNTQLVEFLMSNGADIYVKDYNEKSVLHYAVSYGRFEEVDSHDKDYKDLVEILITHGLDVNARDNKNQTPLHYASRLYYPEKAEFLITHGADINSKDICGSTALHYAAQSLRPGTVKILVLHGANVNEKKQ
ncbi:ankyrin repeat protein, putative [Trichomonas vaginalis G3]|uniref:Ankyrin repeat protein, putative n=1 Tax=Trichomonas vaginalis (strain ATCC PRA-98 / G3) TaxID=412133 RepID=A2EJI3_TRIV3|nr:ankyrin repeat and SOCS box-containing protein 4 family [Trichomonas vaginalis G3]EAY07153.1 ankyrin repeat protein, putative [Trichomonas vaginalis G3]KAI5503676.1 ankyrin repeat and SOCS box-containing protein 4 family [Trichomonas vaginalis G3]|eukprot:XP_001319376.1 ankyrin repeat protein [Trichomonas vaginalis G3]